MRPSPFVLPFLFMSIGAGFSTFGQSKFSVSASFAPFYSFHQAQLRVMLPDGNGNLTPFTLDSRSAGRSLTPGLMVHYAFSSRWSVSTGFWVNYNYFGRSRIQISPPPEEVILGSRRFRNFESPLFINYRASAKRLSPYVSAGALFQFPNYVDVEGIGRIRFDRRVEIAPMLGAGADYRINDRFRLTAQPTLIWRLPDPDAESSTSYRLGMLVQAVYGF